MTSCWLALNAYFKLKVRNAIYLKETLVNVIFQCHKLSCCCISCLNDRPNTLKTLLAFE